MIPEPNVPLMRKVLEQIRHEPERWEQTAWVTAPSQMCDTSYCFAGWALHLSGHELVRLAQPTECCPTRVVLDGEDLECVGSAKIIETARAELGIDRNQASNLFCADNSLQDLERLCEQYSGEVL